MLKPAVLYRDVLLKEFAERMYSDEYFWYTGYGACNELPEIEPRDELYQWAIVDSKDNLIGYLDYKIEVAIDTVSHFGIFSFDKGNPLVDKEAFEKLEELIAEHRRIMWIIVDGNPIKENYDRVCEKYNGSCAHFHQVSKDIHGMYHDVYIYEILRQ